MPQSLKRFFDKNCTVMNSLVEYLHALPDFSFECFGRHPCGTFAMTSLAIVLPFLYYLYNRHLRQCTFHVEEWASYEVERGIRRNKAIRNEKFTDSLDHTFKGKDAVKTVYDCFMHGRDISNNDPCLGRLVDNFKRVEWISYKEVDEVSRDISRFLRVIGIKRQECVGIYAANSCEWVITELACVRQSIITVPLYDTLGVESIAHSIKEVEMKVMFCESEKKLKRILADRNTSSELNVFVLLQDKVEDATFAEQCKAQGIQFLTWSEAKAIGAKHPEINDDLPLPEDIFIVQYTSGTTGGRACTELIASQGKAILTKADTQMLYLPLAHVYGQMTTVWFWYIGGKSALSSGNTLRLLEDCQAIKPTYFALVPRIMNRLYTKVLDQTKSGFKAWLFWRCYERKKALFKSGIFTRNSIYDWIAFRGLQNMIGGRVNFLTTASAPVAAEVLEFWRVVYGAVVLEAYGQTESTSAATCAIDVNGGNVGHPLLCCMVRLLDLPELGYTNDHNPPQGEICLKGTSITPGYYKRAELSKETFTPDGWLLTGDIGEFLPDGSLRIIDRRKHIFKLCQGEYIAPEKVESVYAQCPYVAQVFVDGSSLQTYAVAIVVPDEKEADEWATKHGLRGSSLSDLCTNKKFQLHILEALHTIGKKNGLNSLEQIKSLHLHPEQFTVGNGLLTPTMKNKRNDLRRRFLPEMEALYKAGPIVAS